MPPVVVIVGPPGSGKTTAARAVAARTGLASRDTDEDVEASTGARIGDLFVEHGEAHFRALERAAVAVALAEHDGVLAVGGGAVLDDATRELLRGRTVVFLDVGIKDAASRIGLNRDRPLLLGNPRAQWIRMMEARRPLYQEIASVTLSTDGRTPDEVAEEIVREAGL
jgi:shikimate kinase